MPLPTHARAAYRGGMSRLTVTLPDPLAAFVEDEVAARGFASREEYLRELVRRERDRQHLRRLLLDGPASGPGDFVDDRAFADLREAIRKGAA